MNATTTHSFRFRLAKRHLQFIHIQLHDFQFSPEFANQGRRIRGVHAKTQTSSRQRREHFRKGMDPRHAPFLIQEVTNQPVLTGDNQRRAIPVAPHRASRSSRNACLTRSRSAGIFTIVLPFFLKTLAKGASVGLINRNVTESSDTDSSTKRSPGEN